MGVIAVALSHLIASGVTGDALVAAVAEMEAAQKPERSSAAARQQRYRDRRNALRDVTDVTVSGPSSPPIPPSDGFPDPSLTPPLNPPTSRSISSAEAEAFWKAYPAERRREKPSFLTAWKVATGKATPEALMDSLARYCRTAEVRDGFAPYPAKWLKQERWNEEFNDAKPTNRPVPRHTDFASQDYHAGADGFVTD